jgi:hypothetical protein
MSDLMEKSATRVTHIQNGIRRSYDTRFNKLMVINYTEKTNNCITARKFECCGSQHTRLEETTVESDKCKLHPKIF